MLSTLFFQIYPIPRHFSLLRAANRRIIQKLKEAGEKNVLRPTGDMWVNMSSILEFLHYFHLQTAFKEPKQQLCKMRQKKSSKFLHTFYSKAKFLTDSSVARRGYKDVRLPLLTIFLLFFFPPLLFSLTSVKSFV